jgi:hypothetical protein
MNLQYEAFCGWSGLRMEVVAAGLVEARRGAVDRC